MKWVYAMLRFPFVFGFLVLGSTLRQPTFVSEHFAEVWWGLTVAIMVASLGMIGAGLGPEGDDDEPGPSREAPPKRARNRRVFSRRGASGDSGPP